MTNEEISSNGGVNQSDKMTRRDSEELTLVDVFLLSGKRTVRSF